MAWKAEQYQLANHIQESLAIKIITESINGHLMPDFSGKKILDLGCGTGNITSKLITKWRATSVKGIDLSQSMIDYCCKNYDVAGLTFERGDISNFSYDNEYDIITSFFCIHWLSNQDKCKVFENVYKSLRPGGYFLCIGGIKNSAHIIEPHPLIDAIRLLYPHDDVFALTHYDRLTKEEAIESLNRSRLKVKCITHENIILRFGNKNSLREFIKPLVTPMPLLSSLSDEQKEELIDKIISLIDHNNYLLSLFTVICYKPTSQPKLCMTQEHATNRLIECS